MTWLHISSISTNIIISKSHHQPANGLTILKQSVVAQVGIINSIGESKNLEPELGILHLEEEAIEALEFNTRGWKVGELLFVISTP